MIALTHKARFVATKCINPKRANNPNLSTMTWKFNLTSMNENLDKILKFPDYLRINEQKMHL